MELGTPGGGGMCWGRWHRWGPQAGSSVNSEVWGLARAQGQYRQMLSLS